jgi:hypothetical protein
MLCNTCQRVKPRNLAWFNNHRHVCTCPWEQPWLCIQPSIKFLHLSFVLILWCSHLKAGRFDGGPCSLKSPFGLFEGNAKTAEKVKFLHHAVLHIILML